MAASVTAAPGDVLDFVSDLHLHACAGATLRAWQQYLEATRADAVFILGDLFEAWVGDDALLDPDGFEATCAATLRRAGARRRKLFFLRGNRDFLTGAQFDARCATTTLPDPCVLDCGGTRLLLSHGDALCLQDHAYQRFRTMVRSPAWQAAFLALPLGERRHQVRGMRAHSEQYGHSAAPIDLDTAACRQWLRAADAHTLIHGHTHRPARHDLGGGMQRLVLSDWDLDARPPRAEVLRWAPGSGLKRWPLQELLETP